MRKGEVRQPKVCDHCGGRFGLLTQAQDYLFGHDEYWSGAQRANVEAARDAGVNLLFWSGNEVYWRTRYADSIDGSGTDYRTLVSYKETWANGDPTAGPASYANIDPSNEWTGTWRDLRFVDSVDANGVHTAVGARPENSLTRQLFCPDGIGAAATADGKWHSTARRRRRLCRPTSYRASCRQPGAQPLPYLKLPRCSLSGRARLRLQPHR